MVSVLLLQWSCGRRTYGHGIAVWIHPNPWYYYPEKRADKREKIVRFKEISIVNQLQEERRGNHGGIIRKELPQHSFTIVVSEASTPPTPPLAWSTELPLYPRQNT